MTTLYVWKPSLPPGYAQKCELEGRAIDSQTGGLIRCEFMEVPTWAHAAVPPPVIMRPVGSLSMLGMGVLGGIVVGLALHAIYTARRSRRVP